MAPLDRGRSRCADGVPDAKDALRARSRAARAQRPFGDGSAVASLALPLARGIAVAACYGSVDHEPDTWPLIHALDSAGVRVLLPVLRGHREPAWGWYRGDAGLVPGWHGIPEPAGQPLGAAVLAEADIVFCSAMATTERGDRLGVGGGWYDRALAHARPDAVVAAVCFDDEVLEAVPVESWDRRVDQVVTERRRLRCDPGREQDRRDCG